MYPATKMIPSPAGKIACWDTGGDAPALFFIHGNSACKEAFIHQFESPLLQDYRLVAIDLPGHGESDNVVHVKNHCTIALFAKLIGQLIHVLDLKNPVVLGWSLGGHIGIEMLGQGMDMAGLVISGTPPCGPGAYDIAAAFIPSPHLALTGKAKFTDEEAQLYADNTYGTSVTEKLLRNVSNAQGSVRRHLLENLLEPDSAHGQKKVVASTKIPIAVLQGENDSFMRLDYFGGLRWNSLWRDEIMVIKGAGHAPFLEKPEDYNITLSKFLKEVN